MNYLNQLRYALNVNILGMNALRINRYINQIRTQAGRKWTSEVLSPPLKIAPKTKELIGRHYLRGNFANLSQKVAWVTSGAPIEYLKALGYYLYYPENHGAVCGTLRVAESLACSAEEGGYSQDICSYARTDIGAVLSQSSPIGKIPNPDLLVACTNICQTVLHWYKVLAHHFDVPLILIDAPFIYRGIREHDIAFVKSQLEDAIVVAEQVSGRSLDHRNLSLVAQRSLQATQLWEEILRLNEHHPAPISVVDQFIHMAPIVEMRGEEFTVKFYQQMLAEVKERVRNGVGVVKGEKKRLLWDNLPIWYRLRFMAEYLGERGVAIIASTYTNAWAELSNYINPHDPIESMARTYMHAILNRGTGDKLDVMKSMIKAYTLDGAILHSDRSCKPYSVGQIDQRDRLISDYQIPAVLIEADHNDPRAFSEEQVINRLDAFLEMLDV